MLLVPNIRCQRSPICELDLYQYAYHTEEEFAARNLHMDKVCEAYPRRGWIILWEEVG